MIEQVAVSNNTRNELLRVTLDLLNVPCGGGVWGVLYQTIMNCGEQGKTIINPNSAATPPILTFGLRDVCEM